MIDDDGILFAKCDLTRSKKRQQLIKITDILKSAYVE